MNYFTHFKANLIVLKHYLYDAIVHFIHGIFQYFDHERKNSESFLVEVDTTKKLFNSVLSGKTTFNEFAQTIKRS